MNDHTPPVRQTSLFARRGAFVALGLALAIDLVALAMGISEDGWGWAFNMPQIALAGIVGLTASVGGLILSILRLIQRRGKDAAIWVVLIGTIITGIGSLLLVAIALAASASV